MTSNFVAASEYLNTHDIRLSDDVKLKLYGLYKQGTVGDCDIAKPSLFQFVARAKWDAWNALKGMPKNDAEEAYVQLVEELDVGWSRQGEYDVSDRSTSQSEEAQGMGNAVSKLSYEDDADASDDGFFGYVQNNNIAKVREYAATYPGCVNEKDEQGLFAIHHASDRGYTEMIKLLLELGAEINATTDDGETPLHYACISEQLEAARYLIAHGCDTTLKDDSGSTAFEQAEQSFLSEIDRK